MSGWNFHPLLFCLLYFVGRSLAGEYCKLHGSDNPVKCSSYHNKYCCGSYSYRYCCANCNERYPKPNCEDDIGRLSGTMYTMRITWIVIGAILAIKAIAALIYFCCCRRNNRRSHANRTQTMQVGVNVTSVQGTNYPGYVPPQVQVDAPPSYDDLMKDGVLNVAYEHPQCDDGGNPTLAAPAAGPSGLIGPNQMSATTTTTAAGLPPPPPYYPPNETTSPQPTLQQSSRPSEQPTLPSQSVTCATPQQ